MALNCSPIAMAATKRQLTRDWSDTQAGSRLEARRLVGAYRPVPPIFEKTGRALLQGSPFHSRAIGRPWIATHLGHSSARIASDTSPVTARTRVAWCVCATTDEEKENAGRADSDDC